MGTPIFAVPILKSLYQNGYPVSVVYTQSPKKSSRGMKIKKSPVHNMAETLNIDVRTPEEFKEGHIEESSNVEWQIISSIIDEVKKDQKIYLYCRSGRRSQNATDILIDLGYEDVTNLGGINDAAIFLDRNITE